MQAETKERICNGSLRREFFPRVTEEDECALLDHVRDEQQERCWKKTLEEGHPGAPVFMDCAACGIKVWCGFRGYGYTQYFAPYQLNQHGRITCQKCDLTCMCPDSAPVKNPDEGEQCSVCQEVYCQRHHFNHARLCPDCRESLLWVKEWRQAMMESDVPRHWTDYRRSTRRLLGLEQPFQ